MTALQILAPFAVLACVLFAVRRFCAWIGRVEWED